VKVGDLVRHNNYKNVIGIVLAILDSNVPNSHPLHGISVKWLTLTHLLPDIDPQWVEVISEG
jgi:hypothetical protein